MRRWELNENPSSWYSSHILFSNKKYSDRKSDPDRKKEKDGDIYKRVRNNFKCKISQRDKSFTNTTTLRRIFFFLYRGMNGHWVRGKLLLKPFPMLQNSVPSIRQVLWDLCTNLAQARETPLRVSLSPCKWKSMWDFVSHRKAISLLQASVFSEAKIKGLELNNLDGLIHHQHSMNHNLWKHYFVPIGSWQF